MSVLVHVAERERGDQLVYVASPISSDLEANYSAAMAAGSAILEFGPWWVPHIPQLSIPWHRATPREYGEWMRIDRAVIDRCDILIRIGGDSPGGDEEVRYALHCGIPVVDPRDVPLTASMPPEWEMARRAHDAFVASIEASS